MATLATGLAIADVIWPRVQPFLKGSGKKKLAMAMAAVQAADSEDATKLLKAQMNASVESGEQTVSIETIKGWMFLVDVAQKHSDRAGDILRGVDDDEPTP